MALLSLSHTKENQTFVKVFFLICFIFKCIYLEPTSNTFRWRVFLQDVHINLKPCLGFPFPLQSRHCPGARRGSVANHGLGGTQRATKVSSPPGNLRLARDTCWKASRNSSFKGDGKVLCELFVLVFNLWGNVLYSVHLSICD